MKSKLLLFTLLSPPKRDLRFASTFIFLLLSFVFFNLSSQIPQGFNYQAIARDVSGNPILNTLLPVRITIQSDSLGGTTFWIEEHSTVTTNAFGLFTVIMGKGLKKTGSTVAAFTDIDWKVTPKYIKTEIYHQTTWKNMGSTRLWSVPYSQVSGGLSGALTKLAVKSNVDSVDSTIFEVKNNTGQTIFAVYNEGVRVYVDNGTAKGAKGGFAIGGFGTDKAQSQEYLRVTKDSTRVYISQTVKGVKGGFAIGGFSGKATIDNLMDLTKNNYFIGHQAGMSNTTGIYNSFMGYQAGLSNLGGNNNIFMGFNAGYSNKAGNDNIFIGNMSGKTNNGYSNVFIGHNSGVFNIDGAYNIFLGEVSGYNNTYGSENIFLGYEAGVNNLTGSDNIYIGPFCANSIKAGNGNVMLGIETASGKTSGSYNVLLGSWSGGGSVTGTENVMVGTNSGYNCLGDKNVFLGNSAGMDEAGSNKLYIDNSSTSSPLIYGDFTDGIEKLVFNGNVGVGSPIPSQKLDVNGNARFRSIASGTAFATVYRTIDGTLVTATSDIHFKENINVLNNCLNSVLSLRGISFTWKGEPDMGKRIGFIAQEVEKVVPELVFTNPADGYKGVNYAEMTAVLVEAIKEQQQQIESTKNENLQLKSELQLLKEMMEQIEAMMARSGTK
jgi:hypothetical protein